MTAKITQYFAICAMILTLSACNESYSSAECSTSGNGVSNITLLTSSDEMIEEAFLDARGQRALFEYAGDFSENGLASISADEYGFIDENGEIKIPIQFDDSGTFAENGLAPVKSGMTWDFGLAEGPYGWKFDRHLRTTAPKKIGGKWGFIDKEGTYVIQPKFDEARSFSKDGLAAVKVGELWGFSDQKGNLQIPASYTDVGNFNDGLASVQINGKWGFINTDGKLVIAANFDGAKKFHSALAPVASGDMWGYINKNGDYVIDPSYSWAGSFSHSNLAVVSGDEGATAFIDTKGNIVISDVNGLPIDGATGFSENGLAAVQINDKWGYINTKGELVITPQFADANPFAKNGLASVYKNRGYAYYIHICKKKS